MKKKLLSIIMTAILYVAIIFLSCYYVIAPNAKKLNDATSIKELTYEEKTALIDEVNKKYVTLEQETNDKYAPSIEEVNSKYDKLEQEIEPKYKKQEQEIETKYDKKESELNTKVNNKRVEQNNEFYANGFTKKFYSLQDDISKLEEEKRNLNGEKEKELKAVKIKKDEESAKLSSDKDNELRTINNNKYSEVKRLNDNKNNEISEINSRNDQRKSQKVTAISMISLGAIIIIIPLLYFAVMYNKLTKLYNAVKASWSEVDIYLKQRSDLIPNIVEAVKGYSGHEKGTLTEVTKARTQVISATSKQEEISANENLSNAVQHLFALAEAYPDLKANNNFMDLQDNLREIEDNIALSRRKYNNAVLNYKNKIELFPSNITANIFNFKPELFFEISKEEKENPEIKFN